MKAGMIEWLETFPGRKTTKSKSTSNVETRSVTDDKVYAYFFGKYDRISPLKK